jgi:2,3-dihydroxybenzoate decarboxylase
MKKIILEEHFSTPETQWYTFDGLPAIDFADYLGTRLADIEQFRLPEMDQYGIDVQVLSLNPPGIQAEPDAATAVKRAKLVNDVLAEVMRKYPTRFAGFAALPLQNPSEAASELERAVTQLGLRGAMINGHTNGEYLDEQKFWGVFERAEALGVPIYLHPGDSPRDQMKIYDGYPEMLRAGWNWGVETATHAVRMIYGGVFDAFPDMTLILGHMGEMLPYTLWRLDNTNTGEQAAFNKGLKKKPSQYVKEQMMVTTSGVFSAEPLLCAYLTLGAERILFSVDYPYESLKEGVHFIEHAPISDADKEKICHSNAEKLLRL